jgi:hypothetical protein
MSDSNHKPSNRGPVALGELIGQVINPVTKRRGFVTTDLIAAWPEIVGSRFADCTRPEKITWSRGKEMDGEPGLLVIRVDGPRAIFVQHEAGQIVERVNAFLGYGAIGHLRIVQAPVRIGGAVATPIEPPLSPRAEAELDARLSGVADEGLRSVLERLGRGILADRRR